LDVVDVPAARAAPSGRCVRADGIAGGASTVVAAAEIQGSVQSRTWSCRTIAFNDPLGSIGWQSFADLEQEFSRMPHRDIIVVGTSMGGFDALPQLLRGLPADLEAALLIVMHMEANGSSWLAERLARVSPLPIAAAVDQEELCNGRIYVAIPDHHLMIEGERI
jgi:chemotaxis response regulator CheB